MSDRDRITGNTKVSASHGYVLARLLPGGGCAVDPRDSRPMIKGGRSSRKDRSPFPGRGPFEKRGTSLTFETIVELERGARDAPAHSRAQNRTRMRACAQQVGIYNVATRARSAHSARTTSSWACERSNGNEESILPGRPCEASPLKRFDSISRNGEGHREGKGPYELSRGTTMP